MCDKVLRFMSMTSKNMLNKNDNRNILKKTHALDKNCRDNIDGTHCIKNSENSFEQNGVHVS